MRGAHLRRGHQLSAPKHPDYVDHIRYFVGNHITRVKRAQDIPEDILKGVGLLPGWRGEPYTDAGRAVEAAYSVAVAGENGWISRAQTKGTGLAALCGELCAPAGGHSVR